jgi:CheY-like chemotaxis protein
VVLERDLARCVGRLSAERFDLLVVDGGSYSHEGALRVLRALPAGARAALLAPPARRAPVEPPAGTRVLSAPLAPSELQGFALDAPVHGEPQKRFDDARQKLGAAIGKRPVRVLVVEDNRINQVVARKLLERLGCSVEVASDGGSAIELVAAHPYDLVFMDCQMPGIDGYAATRAIREREAAGGGRTTIVALTAQALEADRERCLAARMDDYLAKPLQLDALVSLLAARLGGAGGGMSRAS